MAILRVASCFLALAVAATAYMPSNGMQQPAPTKSQMAAVKRRNPFVAATATAALTFLLSIAPVEASNSAGQIELNSIPPTSINVDINDLPIIGKIISGTYTKVADGSINNPSITIKSPKDKVAAIKGATTGHLEFDVKGLIGTHLDVDIVTDESGVATVRVASPLIPKLPFKNAANKAVSKVAGDKKPSDWSIVTNLGDGKSYYYNEKTGMSRTEKP